MCFNKEVSFTSFIFALITQYTLVRYGDPKYYVANLKIAKVFFWVALMQIVEFFIWIDPKCNLGFNKIAGVLGPILNYLQPIVIFLIFNNFNYKFINLANIFYLICFVVYYLFYLNRANLCSVINSENHIEWSWSHQKYYYLTFYILAYYFALTLINFYLAKDSKYLIYAYLLSAIALWMSYRYFNNNIGELWCFFVIFIPFIVLVTQTANLL